MSRLRRLARRLLRRSSKGAAQGDQGTAVLRGYTFGMFANVHHVAAFARAAEADGRDFVIQWDNSPYADPDRTDDPWLAFFEPVFPGAQASPNAPSVRALYPQVPLSSDHLFHPRLIAGQRDTMTLPADRQLGHDVLARYIRLNRTTQAFIDDFAATFFTRPVIGLHLRGPGRLHGGAAEMREMAQPGGGVPYALYFDAVDAALADHPEALVFGCSDSAEVIEEIAARYGERALFYPATRSRFGEMQDNHPENEGQEFAPYKLGLDVIVEAHLLARSTHFVHGNSNVANYVLCRAPEMPSTYVYEAFEPALIARAQAAQDAAAQAPNR